MLSSFQCIERFGFNADAVIVGYTVSNVATGIIIGTPTGLALSAGSMRSASLRAAHRRVIEQTRRADEYAAQHPYVEALVEEDSFNYPPERNIDTRSIHRLRAGT
jgi:hypothetical protein